MDSAEHLQAENFRYYNPVALEDQSILSGKFITYVPVVSDYYRYFFLMLTPSGKNDSHKRL
jgi:hypothetical protein